MTVPELCRELGISSATFYQWRAKFGGMDASLMARIKELGELLAGTPVAILCAKGNDKMLNNTRGIIAIYLGVWRATCPTLAPSPCVNRCRMKRARAVCRCKKTSHCK